MASCKENNMKPLKILKYPDSAMQSAIAAVRNNTFKIREAARHFGVPHSTLINKLKGRVPEYRTMGRQTYLTKNEENLLKKYILANAKKGIPLNRQCLIDTVKKILDDDQRVTPFNSNRPGRKWIDLFLKRHPEIIERQAEGISTSRACVSQNDLKDWHKTLKDYLGEVDALDILNEPQRIYNADESGFQTCPESGKVLGPVGMKNFYNIKSGKEKEQLTVMLCINAAGEVVSPMVVYPLVRISKEISSNVPEDWAIGKSPKGWMTGPLYYEYIANVFDPWLKANNVKKPVLLLIDGHRSHLTLQVSQYCAENQIIAYALFPNSTHISQPADVSVFKCLKSGWKSTVSEYKQNTGNRQITRSGFAPLLAKVFRDRVTPDIIRNGFKKCVIYPFDVNGIDFSRCMDSYTRNIAPTSDIYKDKEIGVETLLLLESLMRRGRAEQFRQSGEEWEGDDTAKELFYVWKKFREHCLSTDNAKQYVSPENMPSVSSSLLQESPSILKTPPLTTHIISDKMAISPSQLTKNYTQTDNSYSLVQIIATPSPRKTPDLPEESHTPVRSTTPASPQQKLPNVILPGQAQSPLNTQVAHLTSGVTADETLIEIVAKKQKLISPAFGRHIIWPSQSPLKKRNTERLPFATTSKKWQDYWSAKEKEKEEKSKKSEKKKQKLAEKLKKRTLVTKRRVIRSDSESETEMQNKDKIQTLLRPKQKYSKTVKRIIKMTSDSEDDCGEKKSEDLSLVEGDYVIFIYEGEYYVGIIEGVSEEGALIKSMQKSLLNWKWPEKSDINLYNIKDVIEKIKEPVLRKRGVYFVEEFEKYRDFV